jgi:hypothetical protein
VWGIWDAEKALELEKWDFCSAAASPRFRPSPQNPQG